jgi:hypothetical protein
VSWSLIALDKRAAKDDDSDMTKEEEIAQLKEAFAAEEFFPGVLGNPVVFAAKWGLPLSRSYVKDLERRKADADKKKRAERRKTRAKSSS